MKRIPPLLMAAALALPAWAHEGEDHGAPAVPAPVVGATARATSATEAFELVAVPGPDGLTVYLDRFETNEPVVDAQIDVDSGTLSASARPLGPGVYRIETEHFARSGNYPMTISIQAGALADLMTTTLEISAPVTNQALPADGSLSWKGAAVWGSSGALLLTGLGLVAVRRKRRNLGDEESSN